MASTYESKAPSEAKGDIMTGQEAPEAVLDMHVPYTEEEEKAVLRKIDLVVLPFVSDRRPLRFLPCIVDSYCRTDVLRLHAPVFRQAEP